MANNITNINKTKESLNSDGQQYHQYQQNNQSPLTSTHWTEIQVLTWNRHNNVAGLMVSQPPLLITASPTAYKQTIQKPAQTLSQK